MNAEQRLAEVSAKLGDLPMRLAVALRQGMPLIGSGTLPSMPGIPTNLLSPMGQMPGVSRNVLGGLPPSVTPGSIPDYSMPSVKKWSSRTKPPAVRATGLAAASMPSVRGEYASQGIDTSEVTVGMDRMGKDVGKILAAVEKIAESLEDRNEGGGRERDWRTEQPGIRNQESAMSVHGSVKTPQGGIRPQAPVSAA